jgi:nucleoside-diphosphate-sugar epimerase
MRILVTGHNGYIGSVLVPMLLDGGHTVTGLDSNLFEECVYGTSPAPDIPEVVKDIRDIELADLEGFEAVLHLAALSNDPLGDLNPEWTNEINYAASVHLAELSKQAGVRRFVFSSSCSNYGASGEAPVNEESPLNPVTLYGISKVKTELEVSKLADGSFHPTFLRSGTVYGFSRLLRFDLVLNNLVAWAYASGLVYLKSDGTPWRPIVHVEDVCRAFLAVLEASAERVGNQVFNVGLSEENYQIKDLAEFVLATVPESRIKFSEEAGPDKRCYRVDFRKILKTLPEFKPVWNARRGAEDLYAAFQKHGLKVAEFEGPRYRRVDHIKQLMARGKLDSSLRWKNR